MDKNKKAIQRKLRKKAIKLQNAATSKLTMSEAMQRVQSPTDG
jgi:hypothetical protein